MIRFWNVCLLALVFPLLGCTSSSRIEFVNAAQSSSGEFRITHSVPAEVYFVPGMVDIEFSSDEDSSVVMLERTDVSGVAPIRINTANSVILRDPEGTYSVKTSGRAQVAWSLVKRM